MNRRAAAAVLGKGMAGALAAALLLAATAVPPGLRAQDDTANNAGAAGEEAQPSSSNAGGETPGPQDSGSTAAPPEDQSGLEGLSSAHALPRDSFGSQPNGIPYSAVLRPTGAGIGGFNPLQSPVRSQFGEPANLGNAEGSFTFHLLDLNLLNSVFAHGPEPANADVKLGPLFLKFNYLDSLLLYSDNFRLSHDRRQSSLLWLLDLNMTVIAELGENLHFGFTGSVGYLPLKNEFAFNGSLSRFLGAALIPIFGLQIAYDTVIAGWPVRFADDLHAGEARFSDGLGEDFDLFSHDPLQREQDGTYTFRSGHTGLRDGSNVNQQNASFVYFQNSLSAVTQRDLPNQAVLTARLQHDDLWYNQQNRGLPVSRDDFYISMVSARPNLRFKPYVSYNLSRVSNIPGVTQRIDAGIFGPITDQLSLRAQAGYVSFSNSGRQDALFRLQFTHVAGPYTREVLSAYRDLTFLNQEETTGAYYRIAQTLGRGLEAWAFVNYATFQEISNTSSPGREGEVAGLGLQWFLGPETTLFVGGTVHRQHYNDGLRTDTFAGRIKLSRQLADRLHLELFYEYLKTEANRSKESYYENLIFLGLKRDFN